MGILSEMSVYREGFRKAVALRRRVEPDQGPNDAGSGGVNKVYQADLRVIH